MSQLVSLRTSVVTVAVLFAGTPSGTALLTVAVLLTISDGPGSVVVAM
jgi:hypothetical protein